MQYAVELYFDKETEKKIMEYPIQLAEMGITTKFMEWKARPHITLGCFSDIQEEKYFTLLKKLAKREKTIGVTFDSVSMFTDTKTIFLSPTITDKILGIQRKIDELFRGCSRAGMEWYIPERWIPHCTVALTKEDYEESFFKAAEVVLRNFQKITGRCVEIGLVKVDNPVEPVVTYSLRKNPWEEISLKDYEAHMLGENVGQLECLRKITREQVLEYPAKVLTILGIAGGNGLEEIQEEAVEKIYGIDINDSYLSACRRRFSKKFGKKLELLSMDMGESGSSLPKSDLVIGNLVLEYVGVEMFCYHMRRERPPYVSVTIQVNNQEGFVSESAYTHAFAGLNQVAQVVDDEGFTMAMENIGYHLVKQVEYPLPNGKAFVRLDFVHDK